MMTGWIAGANDEGYSELQRYLMESPEAGDIIPGTGGFRKLRWADKRRGKEMKFLSRRKKLEMSKKRHLFKELMAGIDDMRAEREGKITLRKHVVEMRPTPKITARRKVSAFTSD